MLLLDLNQSGEVLSEVSHFRSRGQSARQRGDHSEALEHFSKAAALLPELAWPLLDVGWSFRELGRLYEAETTFRAVLAKDPNLAEGWRGRGAIARQCGDHAKALEHLGKATALDPDHVWTLHDIAAELQELGRFAEAAVAFRAVLSKDPDIMQGWRGLGQLARQRGDHVEALEHFIKAAALLPDLAWPLLDVGWSFRELGRLDEAGTTFRAVVAKDPNSVEGWRGLGAIARQRGDHAEALEHLSKAAALDPDHVWTQHDIASELQELGRFDEAKKVLKSLVETHPNSATALIAYANGIRHRSVASELVAIFEKAVASDPGHRQARLSLAEEYAKNWRLEEAEAIYDAALTDPQSKLDALAGKGQIARRRGQRDVSLKIFEAAAGDPAATDSMIIEFSRELVDAGRFDEAQKLLLAQLARNPQKAAFHLQLGWNARTMGDRAAARAAFLHAAGLEASRIQARIELAEEEFHAGRPDEAVSLLNEVLAESPRQGRAVSALANFAQQLDDLQGALSLQRAAVEIDASNLWTNLSVVRTLAALGLFDEADAELAICSFKFGVVPELELMQAQILNDRGQYAAACALLQKAAARFPSHFEISFQYVLSLLSCGDFEAARRATDAFPAYSPHERARQLVLRGSIAAAEWDLEQSYEYFLEASQINPADPWSSNCAAQSALLRLDIDSAKTHLETSTRLNAGHRCKNRGGLKPSQTQIGQLLDEFRIDAGSLQRLRNCVAAADSVAALSKLVLDAPDYTPAAMSLLIALRQRGLLANRKNARSETRSIPLKIVQYWDVNIPADVKALCETWRLAHPSYQYTLFSKTEARRFLTEIGPVGELVAAFDRAVEPAMKADIFRLAYLYQEGGYYIDADDLCVAPIPTIDPGDQDLLLYQEEYGTTANNFIGVTPGHPAISLALTSAIEAINRGDADILWLSTGPGLLTRAVARFLAEDLPERLDKTLILERHELFKAVAIHCVTGYKQTQKHWSRTAFNKTKSRIDFDGLHPKTKSG